MQALHISTSKSQQDDLRDRSYHSKTYFIPTKVAIQRIKENCDEEVCEALGDFMVGKLDATEFKFKMRCILAEHSRMERMVRDGATRRQDAGPAPRMLREES